MEFKKEEMEIKEELEVITKQLHYDMHNIGIQGGMSYLGDKLRGVDKGNAKGATIRSKMQWKQVGDKCSKKFFQAIPRKNSNSVIMEIRNRRGEAMTKGKDLENVYLDFYSRLYNINKSQKKH